MEEFNAPNWGKIAGSTCKGSVNEHGYLMACKERAQPLYEALISFPSVFVVDPDDEKALEDWRERVYAAIIKATF